MHIEVVTVACEVQDVGLLADNFLEVVLRPKHLPELDTFARRLDSGFDPFAFAVKIQRTHSVRLRLFPFDQHGRRMQESNVQCSIFRSMLL